MSSGEHTPDEDFYKQFTPKETKLIDYLKAIFEANVATQHPKLDEFIVNIKKEAEKAASEGKGCAKIICEFGKPLESSVLQSLCETLLTRVRTEIGLTVWDVDIYANWIGAVPRESWWRSHYTREAKGAFICFYIGGWA